MHTKANPLFKALRVFIQSYFHSTEIKTHVIFFFFEFNMHESVLSSINKLPFTHETSMQRKGVEGWAEVYVL